MRQLRIQFIEGISVTFKSMLRVLKVTGDGTIGQNIHDLFDVEYYRDLEIWVRGHSRLLKLVPFERLGVVSYSVSIVTIAVSVAVCEIFNVKERSDLENRVRGCSRSLGAVQQTICDFLLVGHCKYSSILYHFQVF